MLKGPYFIRQGFRGDERKSHLDGVPRKRMVTQPFECDVDGLVFSWASID